MRAACTAVITTALLPGVAHANMSHLSGSDVWLVLGLVVGVLASIPAFAALTARRGRRLGNFALTLGLWLLLIVLAIAVPTGMHGGSSDAAVTWRIAIAGLVLFVAILTRRGLQRWRPHRQNARAPGHDELA